MMRYRPAASVMAVRARSMRAGLLASTVTPGSTAPVASLTTPAMAVCADAGRGANRTVARRTSQALVAYRVVALGWFPFSFAALRAAGTAIRLLIGTAAAATAFVMGTV